MNSNRLINLLTVIPIVEIEMKGILYIRNHFNEGGNKTKFDGFWRYFVKTWLLGMYPPCDWNICGMLMY